VWRYRRRLTITGVGIRLWALGKWWAWMPAMGLLIGVLGTSSPVRIHGQAVRGDSAGGLAVMTHS
jgi:hypothetical protein